MISQEMKAFAFYRYIFSIRCDIMLLKVNFQIGGLPQMEESKAKKTGGKKEGQKYKSLLVWDILLKKTDENHAIRLKDIEEHLSHYGITAERHSIKRDIDDILALLNKEMDFDLDELEIEERDLLGYEVEYDAVQHGYKVSRRPYDFEELRLLAECVRASKFISKSQRFSIVLTITLTSL